MSRPNPFRAAVAAGCVYELAALHERSPLPTISHLSQTGSKHRRFKVLSWIWAGYVAAHMLGLDQARVDMRQLRFVAWLFGGYALAVAFRITE